MFNSTFRAPMTLVVGPVLPRVPHGRSRDVRDDGVETVCPIAQHTTRYSHSLPTHYSLLTTHYSLLTTHYSLLTTHYSLPATRYSLPATATRYSLSHHRHPPLTQSQHP